MALKEQPKSPLTVKFQQYELSNGVAFYTILVTDIDYHKTWSLPKVRYSELRKLHLAIQQQYQSQQLPDFPPKKFFGNLEPSFLSQRSKALEIYLNNTLKYFNINQLPKLKDFLCPQGLSERPSKDKPKIEEITQPVQTNKDNKSPQLGPQITPKSFNQEKSRTIKMASPSQARPDLDQMIENIKIQFIYISNPSDHEVEPYESKKSSEFAKKKCIKASSKIIENLNLNDIKKQSLIDIESAESFAKKDKELLLVIDKVLKNINQTCSKLNELCKYTNNEQPMDIIHYIQPQLSN